MRNTLIENKNKDQEMQRYEKRTQKRRSLFDLATVNSSSCNQLSRFSPEISFKKSHKKGTNMLEIKAHDSFLLRAKEQSLFTSRARFFHSVPVLFFRVPSFCEKK